MTNSVGSGILGFRRRGVPYPDFPQGLASSLILADHYSKLRVCLAEMPRSAGVSVGGGGGGGAPPPPPPPPPTSPTLGSTPAPPCAPWHPRRATTAV